MPIKPDSQFLLLVTFTDRPRNCIEQCRAVYRFPEECYCPCLPRPMSRVRILVGSNNDHRHGDAPGGQFRQQANPSQSWHPHIRHDTRVGSLAGLRQKSRGIGVQSGIIAGDSYGPAESCSGRSVIINYKNSGSSNRHTGRLCESAEGDNTTLVVYTTKVV